MNSSMSNNKSQSGTEWKIIQNPTKPLVHENIDAQYGPAKAIYLRIPTPLPSMLSRLHPELTRGPVTHRNHAYSMRP